MVIVHNQLISFQTLLFHYQKKMIAVAMNSILMVKLRYPLVFKDLGQTKQAIFVSISLSYTEIHLSCMYVLYFLD